MRTENCLSQESCIKRIPHWNPASHNRQLATQCLRLRRIACLPGAWVPAVKILFTHQKSQKFQVACCKACHAVSSTFLLGSPLRNPPARATWVMCRTPQLACSIHSLGSRFSDSPDSLAREVREAHRWIARLGTLGPVSRMTTDLLQLRTDVWTKHVVETTRTGAVCDIGSGFRVMEPPRGLNPPNTKLSRIPSANACGGKWVRADMLNDSDHGGHA